MLRCKSYKQLLKWVLTLQNPEWSLLFLYDACVRADYFISELFNVQLPLKVIQLLINNSFTHKHLLITNFEQLPSYILTLFYSWLFDVYYFQWTITSCQSVCYGKLLFKVMLVIHFYSSISRDSCYVRHLFNSFDNTFIFLIWVLKSFVI